MAASISASVDEVGVTSRLRDYVGARASEYRRAELEPMVARAAFEIPSTAAVRLRSQPSSARVGGARPGRTAVAASGTIARGDQVCPRTRGRCRHACPKRMIETPRLSATLLSYLSDTP